VANAPSASKAPVSITIDEAVTTALAKDNGVASAKLDWMSASAKADSAKWKRIPSLSASAGYTRLSELPASDTAINTVVPGLGAFSLALPSILNAFSFGLNLEYPVYDGNRVKEGMTIADLQAQVKDVARETVKRSLSFNVRRAYWEAVRATYNLDTLEQNLDLMKQNFQLVGQQVGQGVATRADQLSAQMRLEQATEDLGDARAAQRRAFLSLASLMGQDLPSLGLSTAADDAPLPFALSTKPDQATLPSSSSPLDEAALVSGALARRPETRTAELASKLAEHALALSKAALQPIVAVTGNYTLADPNQRVPFQTDPTLFTGTWAIGLQVNYDIGGVPAALDDIKAGSLAASKAKSDEDGQRDAVAMDVESCIVNLERAMRDLASTESMVAEAQENLRVMQDRVAAGTAKDIDLSTAKFDLLRTNFAVTNKRIDALVAQADLVRATASEEMQ
jgi:outer membrane protein TolC